MLLTLFAPFAQADRYLTLILLDSSHFNASAVDSGDEAIRAFEQAGDGPHQLILLDWKMPGMNRLSTCHDASL